MQAALSLSGRKAENPPAPDRSVREGFGEPISSEPAPSHRPWASARARPRADLDAARRSYSGSRYWPSTCTIEPCWQASAIASCAVRLEQSASVHDLLAQLVIASLLSQTGQRLGHMLAVPPFSRGERLPGGAPSGGENHSVCGSSCEQARRRRRGVAKLEAQLDGGGEMGRRAREQQVGVAHGVQRRGAAEGAADLFAADRFAHVMHHDQRRSDASRSRNRLWHSAAMERVSFSS